MTNNPFFSIVIPMYNDEKYIRDCLDSIFSQSFSDFEVIVVNDGSTDSSAEICRGYEKHGNYKLINQENGGLSKARNNGMKHCSGRYILFIDSDDFLTASDALEKLAEVLHKTKPDVLVYLPEEYDESGNRVIIRYHRGEWTEGRAYKTKDICDSIYKENGIWVTQAPTKIVSRDMINRSGFRFTEGVYHEDDEWVANVFLYSDVTAFLYSPLYGRRRHSGSITNSTDAEKVYKRICDKVKIASLMISHPYAKRYAGYLRYASDYFLNSMLCANELNGEAIENYISYLSQFRGCCKKIISIKAPKQSLKALYIILFGVKKYISRYERKLNG